jgi:hypothetical protein
MCERAFLWLHVGMQIDLGRLRRFVTEPKSNDAQIHPTMHNGSLLPSAEASPGDTSRIDSKKGLWAPLALRLGDQRYPPANSWRRVWF